MAADDLATLLAHGNWLRDLARKLVGDASAEDAVQDTYVAALRTPPDPEAPAKPWLARVLRNASRMSHRSATRRARREDAAVLVEVPPTSPADTVARAETFRMVVELVLALDEPYRSTLLRHYFDGESFAAIARRDAIPEATVRGRHKHALEQLRHRLDARNHGDRRAWLAALTPLAAPAPTASTTIGVIVVKKILFTAAVTVVAAGAIWHWYPHPSQKVAHAASPTSGADMSPTAIEPPIPPWVAGTPPAGPTQHVRKLANADARRQLGAQIAAAQAARKSAADQGHSSTSAGSNPEGDMDKEVIRGAMREVVPFLLECYEEARATTFTADHLDIRAHFTLTGDPDVGTVIDASQLFDENDQPLPAKLDDCMRSTLQTLELPPLGDGDTVEVNYPLAFSDVPPDDRGSGGGSAH